MEKGLEYMVRGGLNGSNLLAALRIDDQARLAEHMDDVSYGLGHVFYEPGMNVKYAYFPRYDAVSSFHVIMADGAAVETAMVGREGAVGGIVSNGRLPAYARSCVMHGGQFYRITLSDLDYVKKDSAQMRYLFARYADCLVAQIFQSVACNASHTIERRAAKWLTAAMDRTGKDEVSMTQDQLGSLLGVGRTYVSRIIKRMKDNGTIMTRRGGIMIKRRDQLDHMSCDCNRLVADHFATVLKGIYPDATDGH